MEWAIYEYLADGVTMTSAVRNVSHGQSVDVGHTTLWPRHSTPTRNARPRCPLSLPPK